jgi:photosystem II reaction center protein PsbM
MDRKERQKCRTKNDRELGVFGRSSFLKSLFFYVLLCFLIFNGMHWRGNLCWYSALTLSFVLIFYTTVTKVAFSKVAAGALPVAALSAPAFALDSIVESLPTSTVALEVQFGAYLAIALGTILPVLFLINLFIQTESRKAGREGGIDSE